MARGEWCAQHNRYLGNPNRYSGSLIFCEDCRREARERMLAEQLRLVSYEEWLAKYGQERREEAH